MSEKIVARGKIFELVQLNSPMDGFFEGWRGAHPAHELLLLIF